MVGMLEETSKPSRTSSGRVAGRVRASNVTNDFAFQGQVPITVHIPLECDRRTEHLVGSRAVPLLSLEH